MLKPYFNKKDFVLYHGDTLKLLDKFPPNHFDMIFADPPYFLSNGSFTCQNGKPVSVKKGDWDMGKTFQDNFEFQKTWIEGCKRLLKPNGSLWISGTYHSIYQCGYALQLLGFHVLNDIAWFKPNASPNLSCRYFTASHETLLWARKDKKSKHKFNYKVMVAWKDNYKKSGVEILHEEGKQMRSVWAINTPRKAEKMFGKHPTQKPIDLLKRIISSCTDKNDVILDPFTGSSTTGIAAVELGRKFIGIDNDKQFLDLSKKRYQYILKTIK